MSNQLPIIELSGSPRERGRAHGEALRAVIRQVYEEFLAWVLHKTEGRAHSLTPDWCIEWARGHIPHIRNYAPDLLEEVDGIADSAGMTEDQLILMSGFLDILDWASPTFQEQRFPGTSGCTSFGVSGQSAGGETLIGQTYDLGSLYQQGAILLRVKGGDAPDALLYTTAGIVGCAGINAAGVAIVINNLIPNDSQSGVPYPFVVRKLLEAPDAGTALNAVIGARRASGMNYVIADETGGIVALESSATDYAVIDGWGGPIGHANHYVCEKMLKHEARWVCERGNSIFRHSRMNYLLRENQRAVDLARAERILSDHANHPKSICHHDEPYNKTVCGMILAPARRKAYISAGNPCQHSFAEYEI
jgi:isopenicillin-N N-acyltransferase-like protein